MMVHVAPLVRVTPVTVIVWLETPTVPQPEVVKPAALPVVDGADHPPGSATSISPLLVPPAAAV
jgi:hypothetical protein